MLFWGFWVVAFFWGIPQNLKAANKHISEDPISIPHVGNAQEGEFCPDNLETVARLGFGERVEGGTQKKFSDVYVMMETRDKTTKRTAFFAKISYLPKSLEAFINTTQESRTCVELFPDKEYAQQGMKGLFEVLDKYNEGEIRRHDDEPFDLSGPIPKMYQNSSDDYEVTVKTRWSEDTPTDQLHAMLEESVYEILLKSCYNMRAVLSGVKEYRDCCKGSQYSIWGFSIWPGSFNGATYSIDLLCSKFGVRIIGAGAQTIENYRELSKKGIWLWHMRKINSEDSYQADYELLDQGLRIHGEPTFPLKVLLDLLKNKKGMTTEVEDPSKKNKQLNYMKVVEVKREGQRSCSESVRAAIADTLMSSLKSNKSMSIAEYSLLRYEKPVSLAEQTADLVQQTVSLVQQGISSASKKLKEWGGKFSFF